MGDTIALLLRACLLEMQTLRIHPSPAILESAFYQDPSPLQGIHVHIQVYEPLALASVLRPGGDMNPRFSLRWGLVGAGPLP